MKRSRIKRTAFPRGRTERQKRHVNEEAEWKRRARLRDNFTCRWPGCGFVSLSIPVHHINEKSQRPDLRLDDNNSACVCAPHHDRLHHTVDGRREAMALGLLGGETYEAAQKRKGESALPSVAPLPVIK